MRIFQTIQVLVRRTSNLLVANMYWMVACKFNVFDALFEKKPSRRNSHIWKSFFIMNIFSNILKVVQECPLSSK